MSDREYYAWIIFGLACLCATWFTFGYMIGVNS